MPTIAAPDPQAAPGGVAAGPARTAASSERVASFRDVFSRTKGIPVIAAFVFGVSGILVFMRQGQDLVRGIGEDDFLQYPSCLLQIAFAVALLFLAIQAWSWSRIIIDSNYGDRSRRLAAKTIADLDAAHSRAPFPSSRPRGRCWTNPASNTWFVLALVGLGLIFFFVSSSGARTSEAGLRRAPAARASRN